MLAARVEQGLAAPHLMDGKKLPLCQVVGSPWVPIREKPFRDSRMLGALRPGELVAILEAKEGYGRFEWADRHGSIVSGWSLMWKPGGVELIRPLGDKTSPYSHVLDIFFADDDREPMSSELAESTHGPGGPGDRSLGYGDGAAYWDQRYTADGKVFDWLGAGLREVSEVLREATGGDQTCKILHVGCGTSRWPEKLYDAGFRNTLNVDISPQVIRRQKSRHLAHRPDVHFAIADATDLRGAGLGDATFDLVLDKTLLDTFACCDRRALVIGDYLSEASRVLTAAGALLIISLAPPERRVPFVEGAPHCDFRVEARQLSRPAGQAPAWAYLARKGPGRRELLRWPELRISLERGAPAWWGEIE